MESKAGTLSLVARLWRAGLRTGFHLLYNQMAWSYDTVSAVVSAGKWRDWQRAAQPFVRGARVLELGHGPGHTLLDLQRSGFQVTGLDLSPTMGRMARRRGQAEGQTLDVVRGRAQTLPFAAAAFDTVLSLFPTPYVVDPATLQEVHRVLVPGGRLVVLPEARLATTSVSNRALEQLYRITGQRPARAPDVEQAVTEPFTGRSVYWTKALTAASSWTAEQIAVQQVNVADSTVLLLIAERLLEDAPA